MNQSLFQITNELKKIEIAIMENGGELGENEEAMLEVLSTQLTSKTDNVVEWVNSQKMLLENISERINQLNIIGSKITKSLGKFNDYVMACMDKMELTKLEGDLHKISIPKPSTICEIVDQNAIDIEFIKSKTVTSIDKTAIKNRLKNGEKIDGAKLSIGNRKVTFK